MKIRIIIISVCFLIPLYIYSQKDYADKINQLNNKGQKEGLWKEDVGRRFYLIYYHSGVKSGIYREFRRIGELSVFGEYCDGKQCGIWYYFGDYEHLMFLFKDFSPNTHSIINEGNDKRYVPDYKCYSISYYPNGNIKNEGLLLWSDGEVPESDLSVEYGEWKYYDETGKLVRTKEFK